jgi:hypothetical protein
MIKFYSFAPRLVHPFSAVVSITQGGNAVLGIIVFIGAIVMIACLLGACAMGLMGRDTSHVKIALVIAAVAGLAVAIVSAFFVAGGLPLNLNPQMPD